MPTSSVQAKEIQYKFWGGISLFVGGGLISLTVQLFGEWHKLTPIGIAPIILPVPIWFMAVGMLMLVGMTILKLYKSFRNPSP